MLGQVDNEQTLVLVKYLDDGVPFLGGSLTKLDYLGQGYNRGDYLQIAAILLIDDALEHLSTLRSLEEVDKAT